MLIHQNLQGFPSGGSGGAIRTCEMAYRVGVDFMLHNLGKKSSIFLGVRARDKLFPALPSSFLALALVRTSCSFELGLIVFSRVLAVVSVSPVGISPRFVQGEVPPG